MEAHKALPRAMVSSMLAAVAVLEKTNNSVHSGRGRFNQARHERAQAREHPPLRRLSEAVPDIVFDCLVEARQRQDSLTTRQTY